MTLPYGKIPPPTCTWKCLLVLSSLWWIKGPCIIWSQVCPLSTGSRSRAGPPKALLYSGSYLLSLGLQHFPSVSLFPLAGLPPRLLSLSAPYNSTHTCSSLQKHSASEHSAFAVLLPQPLFSLLQTVASVNLSTDLSKTMVIPHSSYLISATFNQLVIPSSMKNFLPWFLCIYTFLVFLPRHGRLRCGRALTSAPRFPMQTHSLVCCSCRSLALTEPPVFHFSVMSPQIIFFRGT